MLSRRGFLNSAFGAGLALTTAQQAPAQTPAVQPARKRLIVDAQVHLWKAESPDWPWVPGRTPQMPEPFTIEKLVPLMDGAGVDRAVIIPPDWPGYRNDYGLEAAKRYPNRFAVMGRISLNPRSAALLPKWKEQPGMLGVRVEGWPTDGTADWFWPTAEKAGLPVMFLINGRSAQVVRIAERHPELTLIVDHMGVTADIVKAGKLADAINQTVPDQWSVGARRPHRGTPPPAHADCRSHGLEKAAWDARRAGRRMAHGRHRRLVLAGSREGRASRHRHDDGAIDPGLVHQRHQLLDGERLGLLRFQAGNPPPVRRFRLP